MNNILKEYLDEELEVLTNKRIEAYTHSDPNIEKKVKEILNKNEYKSIFKKEILDICNVYPKIT